MDVFSSFATAAHLLLATLFMTAVALMILRAGVSKRRDQSEEIEGLRLYLAQIARRRGENDGEVAAE